MYHLERPLPWWEDLVVRKQSRILERPDMCNNHPRTSGEPNHMRTLVDKYEVVLRVIQLLGEGPGDTDASAAASEDYDILG